MPGSGVKTKRMVAAACAVWGMALTMRASATLVEWEFPREECQEGLAFSDGVTGILVWGGDDTVKITVGRADLWDHRGGYHWTEEQNYTNIVDAVRKGDKDRLYGLFRKIPGPNAIVDGAPVNPMLLPLGRVVVKVPGATLVSGALDAETGLGRLRFDSSGGGFDVRLAMSQPQRTFVLSFPAGVPYVPRAVPSYELAGGMFRSLSFREPARWGDATSAGFTQELPADPAVSLAWRKTDGDLTVATSRGDRRPGLSVGIAEAERDSVAYWRAFWKTCARISVPDPVIQRMFDYGMYRFAAMTDPDGVPAGLQGPWLEDDRMIPWNGDYHFNINVQECYSPAFRSGHVERLRPLFRMMRTWWPSLRDNARKFVGIEDGFVLPHSVDDRGVCIGGFWTGTIDHASTAWMATLMFRYVRYSRDLEFLRTDAYPFMRGAMRVYRKMMSERDGRLCIPVGPSPEWGEDELDRGAVGVNASFQLAVAHRLARDLKAAAALLGDTPDPMWEEVETRLPSYSAGGGAILIYENQGLTFSHRHHSHLAGLYPFDTIDLNDGRDMEVVRGSFENWVRMGPGTWTGWSLPWASILNTHVGNSTAAAWLLDAWNEFYTNPGHGSRHDIYHPGFSVMRRGKNIRAIGVEGDAPGQEIMQMDGMCASVTAIMELFAHEVGGKTEFFRGCPGKWKDVSFERMLLSDGTRVSGRRVNGKVSIVRGR